MSTHPSQDEIKRRCEDLVYQVGYAFYDVPYIILLNLMVQFEVARETDLTGATFISATEIRKYMGMLLQHRLIKRHANKERLPASEFHLRKGTGGGDGARPREVIYYYLDYREFANVVKYRIAMMRKEIDEKVMGDVGHKGYVCPTCRRMYTPLQIPTLFSPAHNAFLCEDEKAELEEYVPDETDSSDKMQRFNIATAPIRDALRAVEGMILPTVNILAWVAENVKTEVILDDEEEENGKAGKVQVVLGGEDERERVEKERLIEQQRVQNALPIWHTHSTVTGSATTLGIADQQKAALLDAERRAGKTSGNGEGDDDMLLQHYEEMYGENENAEVVPHMKVEMNPGIKRERDLDHEDEEDEDEDEDDGDTPGTKAASDVAVPQRSGSGSGQMVKVNGVLKALEDVTDEDQEEMSPDEYQAYYDAATAA